MEEARSKYREYLQFCKDQEQAYHQMAVGLGVSDSVLSLLFTLWEEGDGLTPTQLYGVWSLSKQTGHSALMWLEERGLVRLVPGKGDRRSKTVYLTDQGREYARGRVAPLLEAERNAFDALDGEEQRTLVALLGKMVKSLKEETAGLAKAPNQFL